MCGTIWVRAASNGSRGRWHGEVVTLLFTEEEAEKVRRSRSYRKTTFLMMVFGWMMRVPLLGVGGTFWYGLLDEGVRSTLAPRWGLLTFHFLNDGMRPTLWHTWQAIAHHGGDYDGIWIPRAPRSRADAESLREQYRNREWEI